MTHREYNAMVAGRQDRHHHRTYMYSKRPVGEMKSRSWLTSILGTTEEEKGRGSNANRIVSIGPQVFLDILFKAAYLVLFFFAIRIKIFFNMIILMSSFANFIYNILSWNYYFFFYLQEGSGG